MKDEIKVIYSYTRAQAIADGVLVDVTELATEAGFKWPTVVTAALWETVQNIPKACSWEDPKGRLWDVLFMAAFKARQNKDKSRFTFEVILHTGETPSDHPLELVCDCGPGDNAEPVLTIGYASDF
jgi:hypothetical protein